MGKLVIAALLLLGCTQSQAKSAVKESLDPCRQQADNDFWDAVEECKKKKQTYDECMLPAEAKMKKDYEACP